MSKKALEIIYASVVFAGVITGMSAIGTDWKEYIVRFFIASVLMIAGTIGIRKEVENEE